jgi:hypothetical protein
MLEELAVVQTHNSLCNEQILLKMDLEFRTECRRTPGNKYKLTRVDDELRAKLLLKNNNVALLIQNFDSSSRVVADVRGKNDEKSV